MIEDLFTIRIGGFAAYPAIQYGLDSVVKDDQYTHLLLLDKPYDCEEMLG